MKSSVTWFLRETAISSAHKGDGQPVNRVELCRYFMCIHILRQTKAENKKEQNKKNLKKLQNEGLSKFMSQTGHIFYDFNWIKKNLFFSNSNTTKLGCAVQVLKY